MSAPLSMNHCPYAIHIQRYADCTLDEEQSAVIEEHLSECSSCTDALARAVESGVIPAWLPSLVDTATTVESDGELDLPSSAAAMSADAFSQPDRYQRLRLQGEGGMGQVWLGWDAVMQRRVALKQLRSDSRNAQRDQRLLQEATSLARLSHANIVAVHEVLILNEQPTLVMEFVDGPTLASISRDFVMRERQAAKIMERLADAIAHAHEQGVIHRDLKPVNVLLSWPAEALPESQSANIGKFDGRNITPEKIDSAIPKLTDFGLAKILESDELTRTGVVLGTPAYMAPEQTFGLANVAGTSADIYGLGAILYDLLTGTPPHVADNPVGTMMLVREREPTAPRLLRPELSKDIETICLKCLQKLPKDRYPSANALHHDLRAYLDGRPISARPLGFLLRAMRWSRRHQAIVASAILATSLVLTVVLGSLWTASKERQLRLEANSARTEAQLSEKKFIAEAARANQALEVNREHFDVALDRVNRLANLAYNLNNKPVSTLDFGREIQQATADIYATYLKTLPPADEWTLEEAHAVTFYIKYMTALGGKEAAVPWLERVKSVAARLEASGPDSPKMREFLAQHYFSLNIRAYALGDFKAAAQHGEKAGKFVDVDPRHASFLLITSAINYNQAGCPEDAVRVANRAVEVYRTAMNGPNPQPDDPATFLEQLRWHREVSKVAGNEAEAQRFTEEFADRAAQFDKGSPYYARVQETIRVFDRLGK